MNSSHSDIRIAKKGTLSSGNNPMDIDPRTPGEELEKENWSCAAGHYENGKIVCIVPKLDYWDEENLSYYVDIAINGQQFSGNPIPFWFYDVRMKRVEPEYISSEGGTNLAVIGDGLFDSSSNKIKIFTSKGQRELEAIWDSDSKTINTRIPPLTWLFGGDDVSRELVEETKEEGV